MIANTLITLKKMVIKLTYKLHVTNQSATCNLSDKITRFLFPGYALCMKIYKYNLKNTLIFNLVVKIVFFRFSALKFELDLLYLYKHLKHV